MRVVTFHFTSSASPAQKWECDRDSGVISFFGDLSAVLSAEPGLVYTDWATQTDGVEEALRLSANQFVRMDDFILLGGETYYVTPGGAGFVQLVLSDLSADLKPT